MAGPGLPESITPDVTTGHVTDHQKIHDLLNEHDLAAQASTKGDLIVYSGGLIKRLAVGTNDQVLTADSALDAGVKWATPSGGGGSSAWTAYTPTWTASTNPAIGNGTLQGASRTDGKTLFLRINLIMGSTTTFGSGDWVFGLPSVTAKTGAQQTMLAHARDAGSNFHLGAARVLSAATSFEISRHGGVRWGPSSPFTWAASDELEVTGVIEID